MLIVVKGMDRVLRVVVSISTCHAGGPGSIPGHGRHSMYIHFTIVIYVFYINIYFYLLTTSTYNTTFDLVLFSPVQFYIIIISPYIFMFYL